MLNGGDELQGYNMYAYCGNNPVMYVDPTGNIAFFVTTMIFGAVIGFAVPTIVDYCDDGEVFNGSVKWYWYVAGTAIGATVGAGIGMAVSHSATGSVTASFADIKWGYAINNAVKEKYDKVLRLSTHNSNSSTVCLGRYFSPTSSENYINIAKANGYTYFDMGDYYTIAKNKDVAWKINQEFLIAQNKLGKNFLCSSSNIAGSYADEIMMLKALGAIMFNNVQ